MSLAVATRYARALADIVFSDNAPLTAEVADQDLKTFDAMLAESPELRNVLLSPAVAASRKRAAAAKLAAAAGLSRITLNFLYVLIDHRRIGQFRLVREAFEAQVNERRGIVRAEVISARELTSDQREQVQAALTARTGKRVEGKFLVDESLLGGMVAKIGSTVYDGSVRGQLNGLRRRLVAD